MEVRRRKTLSQAAWLWAVPPFGVHGIGRKRKRAHRGCSFPGLSAGILRSETGGRRPPPPQRAPGAPPQRVGKKKLRDRPPPVAFSWPWGRAPAPQTGGPAPPGRAGVRACRRKMGLEQTVAGPARRWGGPSNLEPYVFSPPCFFRALLWACIF